MPDMDDLSRDPDFQAWAENVRAHMLPAMSESALNMMLVPTDTDVKFAVELGFSIMMDKPIIAVVQPGMKVPTKLALVADRIVEADLEGNGPAEMMKIQEAIKAAMEEIEEAAS